MKIIINILIIFFLTTNIIYSNENAQFLSLKNNKVNVRYGPGLDYPIKYIYKKKFFPVKVIDKKGNFRRIIDHKKNSGWIHKIMLIKSKSLITTSEKILFKKPSLFSKPIIKIKSGRLLIVKKCIDNWCEINTDVYTGWIKDDNIWGSIK